MAGATMPLPKGADPVPAPGLQRRNGPPGDVQRGMTKSQTLRFCQGVDQVPGKLL